MITVRGKVLCVLFAAALGCSGPKEAGGQPTPQEDWREKKRLAEIRAKAEVLKEELRQRQLALNAKDPQKSTASDTGKTEWRPHADYLGDDRYRSIHTELAQIVEAHNAILDQNPDWNKPRLDLKLD